MDPSVQYAQQQQQPVAATESQPYDQSQSQYQTYDQSQYQTYDQSQYQTYDPYPVYQTTQYPQYTQEQYPQYTQEQYAAYYAQYYATNPYQSQPETTSIHPPGVPVTSEAAYVTGSEQLGQTHPYYAQTADTASLQYQNQTGYGAVPAKSGYRPPMNQKVYMGVARRGGRSSRGGARGGIGFAGRGRGQGRGRGGHHNTAAATSGQPQPAEGQWPPPRMAWCELCRVDCNTYEILEQHRNGKRHKKNLQVFEELQKLNKIMVEGAAKEPETAATTDSVLPGGDQQPAGPNTTTAVGPPVADRGIKRKMKTARGGKRPKRVAADGGPAGPPVPLICELCNVKCDTKEVFDVHLAGKKHITNMKKFQGDQNLIGQAARALEVLYPALQALIPNVAANVGGGFGQGFSLQLHGPQSYGGPAAAMSANGMMGNANVDPTVVASDETGRVG